MVRLVRGASPSALVERKRERQAAAISPSHLARTMGFRCPLAEFVPAAARAGSALFKVAIEPLVVRVQIDRNSNREPSIRSTSSPGDSTAQPDPACPVEAVGDMTMEAAHRLGHRRGAAYRQEDPEAAVRARRRLCGLPVSM